MSGRYEGKYSDELAKRIFLDNLGESWLFPKYFTIETCNNCNGRCIMCPKGERGTNQLELMRDGLFDKLTNEMAGYSGWIEMVCLNSDGEPLLDRKIADKIRKLKRIGIKHVYFSTNAQLLSEDRIGELVDAGLDDIRISMDAYTKETYEKIRKGLQYDTVKSNVLSLIRIRDLRNSRMQIRIRMVELEENKNERELWLNYWKGQVGSGDKVQLMPMHTWSGIITEEEQRKIDFYADKPCVSVFSSLAVNYDGTVQLCDSDIEQKVILGNVEESSIEDIWRSEKFDEIRNKHIHASRNNIDICRGCDHWSRHFREEIISDENKQV